jgi:adenosylmethionine-8-amino-7-oxononanoate aminotransferase
VVVLMPPYCTTTALLQKMAAALRDGIAATLEG